MTFGAADIVTSKDGGANHALTATTSDQLRSEAFEQQKYEAAALTQNGGIGAQPDLYNTITRQSPWGLPPNPGDSTPQPPVPVPAPPPLPPPGDVLHTSPTIETTSSKLGREALVIGGGVGQSFFYGIANLPDHFSQIASSIVVGGTLGAMAKTGKLGAAAALVVGTYFTTRFILDTINDHKRWNKFEDAVEDTWKSGDNFYKNMHQVRDTLGNYTFDTSISMASGYVGYKNPQLGEYILSILRVPPIVPNTPPPFSPAWATVGMYTDIIPPAGFYKRYDDQSPFASSSWEFDIHGKIRRVPSSIISRTPDLLNGNNRDHDKDSDDGDDKHKR